MVSNYSTPFFLFDLERIRTKYDWISGAFPGVAIYYAVKANNHEQVLSTLLSLGSSFDIGSKQEAELVLGLGALPGNLIFSAPVKLPSHIRDTYQKGLDFYVFDSEEELRKLAMLAPRAKVLVRLAVSNEGSLFPLSLKFGAPPEQTISLMKKARDLGLSPYGLAFHVGSQCKRKETWREAMEVASGVWRVLESEGMPMRCMNVGGGFPIPYIQDVPSIEEIAEEVLRVLVARFPKGIELVLEPGRYLVGDSAILVSTIIGQARRGERDWLFLDVGAFHGLIEAFQVRGEFPYRVKTAHGDRPKKPYVLSGPTCDQDDTILNEVWLPEVEVGDKVYIMDTGAYSFVYASNFHGFSAPDIHFISEGEERAVRDVRKEYVGNRKIRTF